MKFVCIGILQQPIGTLQIPSRDLQRVFKFAKLMRKIPNELRSQKRNASHSLPVNELCNSHSCIGALITITYKLLTKFIELMWIEKH